METHQCSMNRPQFFRKAYHNLRNPIVIIKGYTSLMLEGFGGALTDDQREWVTDMKKNVEHLLSLINNLAELSFLEAGIGEKQRTPVDLAKILNSTISENQDKFLKKGLNLVTSIPKKTITMYADEDLILRAFHVLIHNAFAYSKEKDTIQIILKEEEKTIVLSVEDSGPGIASEHLDAIFEGFFKEAESTEDDYKGTGLGLIIARRIAELYGGSLQVESNPGKGSTFILSFIRNP